jgi:hypothetical protein
VSERHELKGRLAEMKIAELLCEYPDSGAVLFSHFGASCFNCPASKEETVGLGVRVHSADPETFYHDLMERISASPGAHGSLPQENSIPHEEPSGDLEKAD